MNKKDTRTMLLLRNVIDPNNKGSKTVIFFKKNLSTIFFLHKSAFIMRRTYNAVGRGFLTSHFMKIPYIAYPPFLKFCPDLPPASILHPYCSFCCNVSLTEQVIAPHDVLFYLMILWICTCGCGVLVSEGPCNVFYATSCQIY